MLRKLTVFVAIIFLLGIGSIFVGANGATQTMPTTFPPDYTHTYLPSIMGDVAAPTRTPTAPVPTATTGAPFPTTQPPS